MRDWFRSGLFVLLFGGSMAFGALGCGELEESTCTQECGENQSCVEGRCGCVEGFLDCDGDASNGCEHRGVTCPGGCTAETDEAFCQRKGAQCGEVQGEDNCGHARAATCGTCAEGEDCERGVCVGSCEAESDVALCARLEKDCGEVVAVDTCGEERTVTCGTCEGGTCTDGVCMSDCEPEDEATFCERHDATCGTLSGPNNCGTLVEVECGDCPEGDSCEENVCVCEGESDEALCAGYARECGEAQVMDRCNMARTLFCGECDDGEVCGLEAPNVCGSCEPETDEAFCSRLGLGCGNVTRADNCGEQRTVSCGACEGGAICMLNQCCEQESDEAICQRRGANCGELSASDLCGMLRTVDCGTCTGAGEVCGALTANVCDEPCVPLTDEELCLQEGATCGTLSLTDNCGQPRQPTCGSCTIGETCGVTNTCDPAPGGMVDASCSTSQPCAGGLLCLTDGWVGTLCKQPCTQDSDCATGTCIPGHATHQGSPIGICGNAVPPGSACTFWAVGSELCHDPNAPAGSALYCVREECVYTCGRIVPQGICPPGSTCPDPNDSGAWTFDPITFDDYMVCL